MGRLILVDEDEAKNVFAEFANGSIPSDFYNEWIDSHRFMGLERERYFILPKPAGEVAVQSQTITSVDGGKVSFGTAVSVNDALVKQWSMDIDNYIINRIVDVFRGKTEDRSDVHGIHVCGHCGCTVNDASVDWGDVHFCPDCGKEYE